MPLSRLIYISRPAFPVRAGWLQGPLAEILATGIRNNPANGLTGILGVERNRFFQVLEGDGACLEDTFARIARDPRHFDVRMVALDQTAARCFADWAVAFAMARTLPPGEPGEPDFETMSAGEILQRGLLLRRTGVVAEQEPAGLFKAG